jgi:hypothetical protein
VSEHRTEIQPTTYGMFTFICSCGVMGGDHGAEQEAVEEAEMHREGRYQRWQVPPGVDLVFDPNHRPGAT